MFDFPSSPTTGQVYAPASGPSWTWDGVAWKSFQTLAEMQIARTFIPGVQGAATVYGYNKPANLRHLEFEGVAAGASGAPAIATGASVWSFGSGGGGGAWGKKLFTAAALPATVTITIGAPGAASSAGHGNDAAATTFGSLITLPGGLKGIQGSNTAYSSVGAASGSQVTAEPTGVDAGSRGDSSDGCTVGVSCGAGVGLWSVIGRAGGSPWGKPYPTFWGSGGGAASGYGYGSGSSGNLNAGSAALRSSVAGQPGAVLLTEYLVTQPGVIERLTADSENRIVNGAHQFSQANGTTLLTATLSAWADQFTYTFLGPAVSAQLINGVVGPGGSYNRGRFIITTPKASLAAGDFVSVLTSLEGWNVGDFMWGSSVAAKPAVLRFIYKGPVGTYAVAFRNAAGDRSFVKSFVIPTANVDTLVTIPVPPDLTGTWPKDNTRGMTINFQLAAGTTFHSPTDGAWVAGNYVGLASMTNGAAAANTFEIAEVGLYLDPDNTGVAPPWVLPDPGAELVRCHRYYQTHYPAITSGYASGASFALYNSIPFRPEMRVMPSISFGSVGYSNGSGLNISSAGPTAVIIYHSSAGVGASYSTSKLYLDARL